MFLSKKIFTFVLFCLTIKNCKRMKKLILKFSLIAVAIIVCDMICFAERIEDPLQYRNGQFLMSDDSEDVIEYVYIEDVRFKGHKLVETKHYSIEYDKESGTYRLPYNFGDVSKNSDGLKNPSGRYVTITKQQFLKIYNDMDLTRVWVNEDIYKFKMRGEQIIVKSRKVLEPHLIIGEHCPENQDKYLDRIREIRDEIKRSK